MLPVTRSARRDLSKRLNFHHENSAATAQGVTLVPKIIVKFQWIFQNGGAKYTAVGKIGDFRQITLYISKRYKIDASIL